MKKKNKLLMTFYVISIIIYCLVAAILSKYLLLVRPFFLLILIPCYLLFAILFLSSFIKLITIIISMVFGRNGNDEVNEKADKVLRSVTKITRYSLIALFLAFLSSIMILDIVLCINKEKYVLVAISIVVWVLLHTLLFKNIIDLIRSEKKPS
ncbi:MAG: hypothetical protein II625_04450 [Bacilli bacterium]|nr:hypothetical protein [Bacilli bacterium]